MFTNIEVAKNRPPLYCACLSEAARRTSSSWYTFGLLVGFLGAAMTLAGGVLGPVQGAAPGTFGGGRGILLTGFGGLCLAFALYSNARATVASTVAAEAHDALLLADKEAFEKCIHAKSAWISSRVASADGIFSRLGSTKTDPAEK